MSAFDSIANACAHLFFDFFGTTATYTRGDESGEVTAIAHDEERPAFTDDGVTLREFNRIWRIKVSDLPLGLPQRGDEITDSGGTFRVLPLSPDEPEWRYADDTRTEVVITTKQVPAGS